jgi:hypothetical protein
VSGDEFNDAGPMRQLPKSCLPQAPYPDERISIPVWFAPEGEKLYLLPVPGSDTRSGSGIAIAQAELPADRDFVPNLPLTQYPSTTNSPAMKSTPKMTLLCRANQFGR